MILKEMRWKMIYVEASRLRLRDWDETDIVPFSALNADENVMQYFPKTLSTEETKAFYTLIVDKIKANGYGLFAVEEKETNEFLGFIGFHRATFAADFTPCIEIGWRLKEAAWGKGFATEGAAACLQYGFTKLGFTDIYSFTADVNTPSQNVMRKIGMQYVKDFDHPKLKQGSILKKHVLYHINADLLK